MGDRGGARVSAETTLGALISAHAGAGRLDWIGLRPERKAPMREAQTARIATTGLDGDRRERPGARAVTLIQTEHLPVIAALARREDVSFAVLRRNLAISGINLVALRKREIRIGGAVLRISGPCAPCSRMEAALGFGGYNAMRGHGGWCAEVVEEGDVAIGDEVAPA